MFITAWWFLMPSQGLKVTHIKRQICWINDDFVGVMDQCYTYRSQMYRLVLYSYTVALFLFAFLAVGQL